MKNTRIRQFLRGDALRLSLAASAAALLLFLICNLLYGIFPCGSKSVVWCDMEQQAVPLLLQLRQIVRSGESVSYTLLDAGGMRFYGVYFFFLSNPLSLLIFCTDLPADQLVTLLVICKLALASGTGAYWFRYRIRSLPPYFVILLGVMYGCSGYGLFYYQNLMWLDVMALFPLLMCALRILQKKGDSLPYLITLSLTMLLCFYLCYMVVLFVLIDMTAALHYSIPKHRRGAIALRFWAVSILAACLTAFVWLPCLIQVMQSGRGSSVAEVLMQANLFDHIGDKICLLGCTALGLGALPALGRKSAAKRDRMLFWLLAAALLLDPINIMWHTGSYQAFPLRWGMIPILLMLTLAGKQLASDDADNSEQTSRSQKRFLLAFLAACAAAVPVSGAALHICFAQYLYSYANDLWVSALNAMLSVLWIGICACAYSVALSCKQIRLISGKLCCALLSGLFLCEFLMNYDCYFGAVANDDPLLAQTMSAAEQLTPDDNTARIRLTRKYAHANMLGALGYPTLAHYTSLTRADFLTGMKRLGYSSYWMEVPSTGGTLLSDAIWNVRYQLGARTDFPSWAKPVWTDGILSIAESELTLPPAVYTDAAPETLTALPEGSRIAVQRMLAAQLGCPVNTVTEYAPTATDNVQLRTDAEGHTICTRIDPNKEGEIRYSMFVPAHQALYFDLYTQTGTELGTPRDGAVSVLCNGLTKAADYPQNNLNGIQLLHEADHDYVVISVKVHHDFSCDSFGVFGIDPDAVQTALHSAEGASLSYEKGVYTVNCSTDRPRTLILSAAYDEGFTATVNGQPAAIARLGDCRMAVRIPEGESHVILTFHVQGLPAGLLLGIAGILSAVLWLLLQKRRLLPVHTLEKYAMHLQKSVCFMLFLIVYIIPILICTAGLTLNV